MVLLGPRTRAVSAVQLLHGVLVEVWRAETAHQMGWVGMLGMGEGRGGILQPEVFYSLPSLAVSFRDE